MICTYIYIDIKRERMYPYIYIYVYVLRYRKFAQSATEISAWQPFVPTQVWQTNTKWTYLVGGGLGSTCLLIWHLQALVVSSWVAYTLKEWIHRFSINRCACLDQNGQIAHVGTLSTLAKPKWHKRLAAITESAPGPSKCKSSASRVWPPGQQASDHTSIEDSIPQTRMVAEAAAFKFLCHL